MEVLTSQLPSGGYGYQFPSVFIKPMTFLEITQYLEGVPQDPLEKYLYDLRSLATLDPKILDCYLMDVDFLIFYRKLITVSGDLNFTVSAKCPECGRMLKKTISLNSDIHFKAIDKAVMEGTKIELAGNEFDTIVPTVREFLNVFKIYLRVKKVTDLKMIKTIALISDFSGKPNIVEQAVLGATHKDITLLLALQDLYYDRVEPVFLHCDHCEKDKKPEERRGVAISVDSLITDFFREICNNSPIDGTEILFKQVREDF